MHRPISALPILSSLVGLVGRSYFANQCPSADDRRDSRTPHWLRNIKSRSWTKSTTRCDIRKKIANRRKAGKTKAAKRAADHLRRIGTKEYARHI